MAGPIPAFTHRRAEDQMCHIQIQLSLPHRHREHVHDQVDAKAPVHLEFHHPLLTHLVLLFLQFETFDLMYYMCDYSNITSHYRQCTSQT